MLDTNARQIVVFSGYGKEIQPLSWEAADKRTYVPFAEEKYELFQQDYHNTLPDMAEHGEAFAMRREYIDAYRYNYAYHPYHAFSMMSCGHLAEKHCRAVYCVGAYEPGLARSMGLKTRSTFDEALKDAEKYVGKTPRILALPRTFKTASVHLCMK